MNCLVLPDYILKALESKGINLDKIDEVCGKIYNPVVNSDRLDTTELNNTIFSKLSLLDQKDVVIANKILNTQLGIDTIYNNYKLKSVITDEEINSFIQLYTDPSVDIKSIIMSNNDVNIKVPFTIKSLQNIIVLIIEKGFFNFITYDVKMFPSFFLGIFVNHLYKMYGEAKTFNSAAFHYFVRLQTCI